MSVSVFLVLGVEQAGSVCNMSDLFRQCPVWISSVTQTYLTMHICGFCQLFQTTTRMLIKHFFYPTNEQYIICRYNWNYKIFKSAPTCFGSQRIHHQGTLYSAWLKITRVILSCPLTWTRSVLWKHIPTHCTCV